MNDDLQPAFSRICAHLLKVERDASVLVDVTDVAKNRIYHLDLACRQEDQEAVTIISNHLAAMFREYPWLSEIMEPAVLQFIEAQAALMPEEKTTDAG